MLNGVGCVSYWGLLLRMDRISLFAIRCVYGGNVFSNTNALFMIVIDEVYPKINSIEIPIKRCWNCKELKPSSCFFNNKSTKDGKADQCKICRYKSQTLEKDLKRKNKKGLCAETLVTVCNLKKNTLTDIKISCASDDIFIVEYKTQNGINVKREYTREKMLQCCKRKGIAFKPIYL